MANTYVAVSLAGVYKVPDKCPLPIPVILCQDQHLAALQFRLYSRDSGFKEYLRRSPLDLGPCTYARVHHTYV